jgi:AAA domain
MMMENHVAELTRSLTLLVHGDPKSGKSTLAATAPGPRLFLDIEQGAKFLNIKPTVWDPATQAPPEDDGTWDTAIVSVREYDTMLRAYQWLQSGKHPFKSVIIDSISELQAKVLENVAGRQQIQTQQWGEILRHMAGMMRDLRDLTAHPTNPLTCVVMTCMSRDFDGVKKPYLQGQAATIAPYITDLTGYLTIEEFQHPDPSQPPYKARRMYIVATSHAMAGERVGGRLGEIVEQSNLDMTKMLDLVFGPSNTNTTATPPATPTATTDER